MVFDENAKAFDVTATGHKDLVHSVAYDYYGLRLATCSSDHTIRVWQMTEGSWTLSGVLKEKGHTGPVWKVMWGHPEFGQVLISCSFDRSVIVWEEIALPGSKMQWVKRTALVDSRNSVKDIDFSPKSMGLKLATCSADGVIRTYEALDVTNLSHWSLMEEFQSKGCSCLSWNPSRFARPMIAVGGDDPDVSIWMYKNANQTWIEELILKGHESSIESVAFAPNIGRSYHLLASGSTDSTIRIWRIIENPDAPKIPVEYDSRCAAVLTDHESTVWRLQWNITGTVLASSSDDGKIKLWRCMLAEITQACFLFVIKIDRATMMFNHFLTLLIVGIDDVWKCVSTISDNIVSQ